MWLHINKCGTTTMASLLRKIPGGLNSFFHHDYPLERADNRVVCMWRDPAERIESTYRMYQKNKVHGWEHWSWPDFVRHICDNKALKDPHMIPQYEVATSKYGRFVPDLVLRWEWSEVQGLYGIAPEVHNHTPGDPQVWSPELTALFEKRFQLDYLVWSGDLR